MKLTHIVLNALAIAAAAALVTLGVVYDPREEWGIADGIKVSLFLIPCFAALVALRKRSSSLSRSIAAWCNAAWAVPLVVLGLGVSTGIGGFLGLLIVILPAVLLLSLNWFALRTREGRAVDA